jgi:RNA polymerase II-associated protein 2
MADKKKPLKGILKAPRPDPDSFFDSLIHPSLSREDRARETAVKHATIIQQQRDHETRIFQSVATLSTYPLSTSPEHTAASPSPSDASSFKALVRLFQPTDFDDLVEERNSSGRCGYALCPMPRRRLDGAKWTLSKGEVIPADEVQKWCSTECVCRALWVRVQLSETAAWERAGLDSIEIELHNERDIKRSRNLVEEKPAPPVEAKETDDEEHRLVMETLKENTVVKPPQAPTLDQDADQHQLVEGHKPAS